VINSNRDAGPEEASGTLRPSSSAKPNRADAQLHRLAHDRPEAHDDGSAFQIQQHGQDQIEQTSTLQNLTGMRGQTDLRNQNLLSGDGHPLQPINETERFHIATTSDLRASAGALQAEANFAGLARQTEKSHESCTCPAEGSHLCQERHHQQWTSRAR